MRDAHPPGKLIQHQIDHELFVQADNRAGALALAGHQATARAFPAGLASRNPVRRCRMMRSASLMMRSISSFTVGTSWIRPTTMPQLQAPASMSPSIITLG